MSTNDFFPYFDFTERFAVRKEIASLPEVLMADESVVTGLQGMMGGLGGTTGLLVATNRRILFVDCGILWGRKVTDFPLSAVSSVEAKTGLVYGSIMIKASSAEAEIGHVIKMRVQPFVDAVRPLLGKQSHPAGTSSGDSTADQLGKLVALRDAGAIDEAEFAAAKARVLGL